MDFRRMASRQAQELIYDAWESGDLKTRRQLAQKALRLDANCLDGYVILADYARTVQEAHDLYLEGVSRGEQLLETELQDEIGYFWGLIETRPFMRAHLGLAMTEWQLGKRDEAVQRLWRHLTLNPNDNQGVREILLGYLQVQADESGLDRLCDLFPFMDEIRDVRQQPIFLDRSLQWVIKRPSLLRELYHARIESLQQLARTSPEKLQEIKGIGKKTALRVRGQAQAYLRREPYCFGVVPERILEPMILLDVRVYPDFNPQMPWGFGLQYPDGQKSFFIVAPERPSRDIESVAGYKVSYYPDYQHVWQALLEEQSTTGFMFACWGKQIRRHFNATAPEGVRKQLVLHDIHQTLADAIAFPLQSEGLQDVSTYLGQDGWGEDKQPFIAHMNYLHWVKGGKTKSLQEAIAVMAFYLNAVNRIYVWLCNTYRE